MRIVSLLPSSTEILCALELEAALVGVSHACDYPRSVKNLPSLTAPQRCPVPPQEGAQLLQHGLSPYVLDVDLLRTVQPDVIVTQLAPHMLAADMQESTSRMLDKNVTIISLQPFFLQDIWDDIHHLGEVTGQHRQARALLDSLFERVNTLIAETMMIRQPPRVLVITSVEPLLVAGYWVPDMIQIAGGSAGMVASGQPPALVEWVRLQEYQPDVLIVMPCGASLEEAQASLGVLQRQPGWDTIPAVRDGQVHLVDGRSYPPRPGPRVVEALELLAGLIHPDLFGDSLSIAQDIYRTVS